MRRMTVGDLRVLLARLPAHMGVYVCGGPIGDVVDASRPVTEGRTTLPRGSIDTVLVLRADDPPRGCAEAAGERAEVLHHLLLAIQREREALLARGLPAEQERASTLDWIWQLAGDLAKARQRGPL